MKRYLLVIVAAGIFAVGFKSTAAERDGRWLPALPEQSLAQWYKPQNKRQVWLHTMFALRRELQAVSEYAAAGDRPRLAKWADRLATNYRKIPEMVPEWADEVELDIAAELEQAAAVGDFATTASAARRLGKTCNSCHREFRALAAARFRTPDFASIELAGEEEGTQSHSDHMDALSRTLNRIKIAAEDDRWEAAAEAEQQLRSLLADLGETCETCHADAEPRERILGEDSLQSLDRLRNAIGNRLIKDAGKSLGEAAVKICARCHGAHRTLYDLRRRLFSDR